MNALPVFLLSTVLLTCGNGKSGTVKVVNSSGVPDVCVKVDRSGKTETKSSPYSFEADEGDSVSLRAFSNAAGYSYFGQSTSLTLRITNSCENEVTYVAEITATGFKITDDFREKSDCSENSGTVKTDTGTGL